MTARRLVPKVMFIIGALLVWAALMWRLFGPRVALAIFGVQLMIIALEFGDDS